MLKVLVTSGGTKVPIDDVRSITNMSKGTFGSKIATEFLKVDEQIQLHFLRAENSIKPFSMLYDPPCGYQHNIRGIYNIDKLFRRCSRRYTEETYKTYDDYAASLKRIIREMRPDIIVLAAAVSDYTIKNPVNGKIRSSDDLKLELTPTEKLIGQVQNIQTQYGFGSILVGFKLLVNSLDKELLAAAEKSIKENKCDLVIANDLRDIKNDDHKLIVVSKDRADYYYSVSVHGRKMDKNYLASVVARRSIDQWNKKFGESLGYKYGTHGKN